MEQEYIKGWFDERCKRCLELFVFKSFINFDLKGFEIWKFKECSCLEHKILLSRYKQTER